MSDLNQKARDLVGTPDFQHYVSRFESSWRAALNRRGLQEADAELMQEFWEELPDSPSIHCSVFYAICDIAEDYCYGKEE